MVTILNKNSTQQNNMIKILSLSPKMKELRCDYFKKNKIIKIILQSDINNISSSNYINNRLTKSAGGVCQYFTGLLVFTSTTGTTVSGYSNLSYE